MLVTAAAVAGAKFVAVVGQARDVKATKYTLGYAMASTWLSLEVATEVPRKKETQSVSRYLYSCACKIRSDRGTR